MATWKFATDKRERETRKKLDVIRAMQRKEDSPLLEKRAAELEKELTGIELHKCACRGVIRKAIETRAHGHNTAEAR